MNQATVETPKGSHRDLRSKVEGANTVDLSLSIYDYYIEKG